MFFSYWNALSLALVILGRAIFVAERGSITMYADLAFVAWMSFVMYQNYKCATISEARRRNAWGIEAVFLLEAEPQSEEEFYRLIDRLKKNQIEKIYWLE